MKNTTKRIVEKFPNLEEKVLEMNGSGLLIVDDIQSLDSLEGTFLKLALSLKTLKMLILI